MFTSKPTFCPTIYFDSDKAILNLTYRYVKNVGIISESMINEFEKVTVNTLNILMKYKIRKMK